MAKVKFWNFKISKNWPPNLVKYPRYLGNTKLQGNERAHHTETTEIKNETTYLKQPESQYTMNKANKWYVMTTGLLIRSQKVTELLYLKC